MQLDPQREKANSDWGIYYQIPNEYLSPRTAGGIVAFSRIFSGDHQ